MGCAAVPGASPSTTGVRTETSAPSPFFDGEVSVLVVDGHRLRVAVADEADERRSGLMGAEDLAGLDGMLFIHDTVAPVSYTMENTVIPLDIWFIDESGVIIATFEMEPCPTGEGCRSYRSPGPVSRVLETELGVYDFEVGDTVSAQGTSITTTGISRSVFFS